MNLEEIAVNMAEVFKISEEFFEKIKDLDFDYALSIICTTIERKCKHDGQDIYFIADVLADCIKQVNNDLGETHL